MTDTAVRSDEASSSHPAHPLDPATPAEYLAGRDIMAAAGLLTDPVRFAYYGLEEAPKGDVLAGAATDRRLLSPADPFPMIGAQRLVVHAVHSVCDGMAETVPPDALTREYGTLERAANLGSSRVIASRVAPAIAATRTELRFRLDMKAPLTSFHPPSVDGQRMPAIRNS